MTYEEAQNPTNLLALLAKRIMSETENINEMCYKLEALRQEGLCYSWKIEMTPSMNKSKPLNLRVGLERFSPKE